MPEISDRIRHFEEIARETNSEPELILKEQHRENLLLSPDNLFIYPCHRGLCGKWKNHPHHSPRGKTGAGECTETSE
nr:hypothetical protein [Bacteroides intestinalis]